MIYRSILPQIKVVLGLSAACGLMLAAEGCNAVAARSCEAITDDIAANLTGGVTQAVICRGLELTLESFDAGCTVIGATTRDDLVAQINANCAG